MANAEAREADITEHWTAVVLAAGKGVRMVSSTPKVLHRLCGMEMALYPVQAVRAAGVQRVVLVVSASTGPRLRQLLGSDAVFAVQQKALGTGDALSKATPWLRDPVENVLVINGDATLVTPGTLKAMMRHHVSSNVVVTFLTAQRPLAGMGRVARDAQGRFLRIVEEAHLTEAERRISEVNAGVYCFRVPWLVKNLGRLEASPVGEVYLTDLLGLAVSQGAGAATFTLEDAEEALGVNNRVELARAEAVLRRRICERWMLAGVTIRDPAATYIDAAVQLGPETVVEPGTMLLGRTTVGKSCMLGPNAVIRDCAIGDGCKVISSSLEEATLEDGCSVGPYSHLRPGTYLEAGVHVGTSAEIKNSRVGRETQVGHFSYIGDARLGARVNIGAGAVTCNFDGKSKHATEVGDGAFVGSDTMLVAPVKVGDGAITGAGAVVTHDVPPGSVVVGVPARAVRRAG